MGWMKYNGAFITDVENNIQGIPFDILYNISAGKPCWRRPIGKPRRVR
jgi:hypothetical protein